jgi:hypothetical protein
MVLEVSIHGHFALSICVCDIVLHGGSELQGMYVYFMTSVKQIDRGMEWGSNIPFKGTAPMT